MTKEVWAYESGPNQIYVGAEAIDDSYAKGEMLIDLPCGLSTEKTYGPKYTTYHCFGIGPDFTDYTEETHYKWIGDPENDHVEYISVDIEGYVRVVLYPGGAKEIIQKGSSWLPKGTPWEIDFAENGKLCLILKEPITPFTPGLKKVEHWF